ncbi:hypothetical protein [Coleofasciculus sp. FACHB-SPT36]|uniref:hypothetical protein n=1 Tax=Cyanophyceae TaxID=3028117 RepID=UPI00168BD63B|nr:hypothetical protein [Coleofasciculus sp. FACHB-SPT36]MBD2538187.1 hypothetical protein [Coleofasciculus sp. FACHB-SPT36]
MTELISLEFCAPKPRYCSVARFENSKGQEFLVRVSGLDRQAVEQYTKNLNVYFEILPSESILTQPDTISKSEEDTELALLAGEALDIEGTVDPLSTDSIEMVVEVANAQNIELQNSFNFNIRNTIEERDIDGGSSEIVVSNSSFRRFGKPRVAVHVTAGQVFVQLLQGSIEVASAEVLANETGELIPANDVNLGTRFSIKVTGLGTSRSEYNITGTWRVS